MNPPRVRTFGHSRKRQVPNTTYNGSNTLPLCRTFMRNNNNFFNPISHYTTFFNNQTKVTTTSSIKQQNLQVINVNNKRYFCSKSTDEINLLNNGEEDEKILEQKKLLEILGDRVLSQVEYKDLISKKYSTTKEQLTPLGEILKSEIEVSVKPNNIYNLDDNLKLKNYYYKYFPII
jgi:hypothetical protein